MDPRLSRIEVSRALLNVGDLALWAGTATAYIADFQVRPWADKPLGTHRAPVVGPLSEVRVSQRFNVEADVRDPGP